VMLRTRPRPRFEQWFVSNADPGAVVAALYRPTSVLWDGERTFVLLEGDRRDVDDQAAQAGLRTADVPVEIPQGGRWSVPPTEIASLVGSGRFVAEIGVGVVHHELPAPHRPVAPAVRELHRRIKHQFDPAGRLNPGVSVLDEPA
jgi:hypothetical protein